MTTDGFDLTPFVAPFYVYWITDSDGEICYVGQTNNLLIRLGQHSRDSVWWEQATRVQWKGAASRYEALREEARLIEGLQPDWNTVGVDTALPVLHHPRV